MIYISDAGAGLFSRGNVPLNIGQYYGGALYPPVPTNADAMYLHLQSHQPQHIYQAQLGGRGISYVRGDEYAAQTFHSQACKNPFLRSSLTNFNV